MAIFVQTRLTTRSEAAQGAAPAPSADGTPMTMKEVGERFSVTKARVGQIEHNAMAKMRREVAAAPEAMVL